MVSEHTASAIAETVFYVPVVPFAAYVLYRNWTFGRPRMAWYPLLLFSLVRLAGGIVIITLETNLDPVNPNIALIITALVLLNIGVVPLIISTIGLIRLIIMESLEPSRRLSIIMRALRIGIIVAIVLLSAGGGLAGSADQSTVDTGHSLTKAGYILFGTMLVVFTGIYVRIRNMVASGVTIYYKLSIVALPFLALRTVYGLIYAFNSDSLFSFWNPLFGNALAFSLMALLPEYITMVIYLYLGVHRAKQAKLNATAERNAEVNK